jgi:hypothetical protein
MSDLEIQLREAKQAVYATQLEMIEAIRVLPERKAAVEAQEHYRKLLRLKSEAERERVNKELRRG